MLSEHNIGPVRGTECPECGQEELMKTAHTGKTGFKCPSCEWSSYDTV